MTKAPSDCGGPLPARRIPRDEQETGFAEGLRDEGVAVSVGEDWEHLPDPLPPRAQWVIYPNGDLQRL